MWDTEPVRLTHNLMRLTHHLAARGNRTSWRADLTLIPSNQKKSLFHTCFYRNHHIHSTELPEFPWTSGHAMTKQSGCQIIYAVTKNEAAKLFMQWQKIRLPNYLCSDKKSGCQIIYAVTKNQAAKLFMQWQKNQAAKLFMQWQNNQAAKLFMQWQKIRLPNYLCSDKKSGCQIIYAMTKNQAAKLFMQWQKIRLPNYLCSDKTWGCQIWKKKQTLWRLMTRLWDEQPE